MYKIQKKSIIDYLPVAVIFLIIFRFILTAVIPLLDKTEARYAEISRLMYETGEWVVLQIDYGEPFWAKPPFSTWLSAISFKLLGVNEMAARLPSFLLSLLLIVLIIQLIKRKNISNYLPAFILLSTPEFLIHTGVVSTDSSLAFAVTLIMLSFWKAITADKVNFWSYLFFIGIGIGILSKGPIVLILTAPPILFWSFLKAGRLRMIMAKLPWISGLLLTLIISIPWFVLVERRSPGFFDYFVVGEHFNRFFKSGWNGDLYGRPKSEPIGKIWVYLMLFAFPWIQIVIYSLWKNRKRIFKDSWVSFLVFWLLWTPLFFTFSSNILHTYILPVMAPMALLICYWWKNYTQYKTIFWVSFIFPGLAVIAFSGFFLTGYMDYYMNSDKYLLKEYQTEIIDETLPLYYWKSKSYSGQFYSSGKAMLLEDKKELETVSNTDSNFLLVVSKRDDELAEDLDKDYQLIDQNYKTELYIRKK